MIRYAEIVVYREVVKAQSEEQAREIFKDMDLQMPDTVETEYFEIEEYKAWTKTLMLSGCRPTLGGIY